MPIGNCKMCLHDKPLVQSHLMARGLYDYCRTADSEPIKMGAGIIMQTSRQTKDYLLCGQCEDVLNKGGENWILPKLATIEKSFPLYEMLSRVTPVFDEGDLRVYNTALIPEVAADKIAHFAVGMFWKASVHSWLGGETDPRIELGPYSEALRRFLLGHTTFPENVALLVEIVPPSAASIGILDPCERVCDQWHTFFCYVPGILFALSVGKQLSEEIRTGCFVGNSNHPLLVSNNIHEKLEGLLKEKYFSTPKSRQLQAAMEAQRRRRR